MTSLAKTISTLRVENKIPQWKLGAAAGMDAGLLSKIERGLKLPTEKQIRNFAKYFNQPVEEWLEQWKVEKLAEQARKLGVSTRTVARLKEEALYYGIKS